jgi:methylase of polypeptide subunit release factors
MILLPPDYPEEYLMWKTTFFGRDFVVTPDVLIPRLETESLVRRARQVLQWTMKNNQRKIDNNSKMGVRGEDTVWTKMKIAWNDEQSQEEWVWLPPETFGTFGYKSTENDVWKKIIILDIGCGSGIIGTSVADLADEVIFLDISPIALKVAEKNFRTHFPDKKAQFIVSDLLSALPTSYLLPPTSSILFVTNLPYIRDEDWKNMSADTVHEPKLALFGGEKTGFEMYERLFEQLNSMHYVLCTMHCIYEFWFDQREFAEEVVRRYPHWEYSFFTDYAGIERFGEVNIWCT